VRYPVSNLAAYRAKLDAASVSIAYEAGNIPLAGIGKVALLAVRDPDGNLTEFYEAVSKGK
jgi:catechol 2,3-dioxygenase-like lactoylglutathione lyase family enzyme